MTRAASGARGVTTDSKGARHVAAILDQVDSLPTLPSIARRMLAIGSASEVNIDEVVKIIEADPALAAKIVGLCRKSDKGLGGKVTSVRHAVVMLGVEAVRSGVLSVAVCDLFRPSAQRSQLDHAASSAARAGEAAPGFDREGFWTYSIGVACAAERIAQLRGDRSIRPEEAFFAGLTHGLGRLALQHILPTAYDAVTKLARRRRSDAASVEREVLGVDHHTAGRRLAERWGLPDDVRDVLWLHDQPEAALKVAASAALVRIVNAARAIIRDSHIGNASEFSRITNVQASLEACGVALQDVLKDLHTRVADRLEVLGLGDSRNDDGQPWVLTEALATATTRLAELTSTLDQQARLTRWQQRVLEAIEDFHDTCSQTSDAAGNILASVKRLLGDGYYVLIAHEAHTWRLHESDARGHSSTRDLEAPPQLARFDLSELSSGRPKVTTLGLLPWLSEHLTNAPDIRTLRVAPLDVSGAPSRGDAAWALVTDRALDMGPGGNAVLRPLLGAWHNALLAQASQETLSRLNDEMAEATRSLAEAQAALARQDAMAKLGEITAGAAHEINNPLTVISGRGQLLASRMRDVKDKTAAQQIVAAAQQVASLVQDLHLFANPPSAQPRRCALGEVVSRAVVRAGEVAGGTRSGDSAVIDSMLSRAPQELVTDPQLLGAALAELIANAIEACPKGPIVVRGEVEAGRLVLRVIDAGPGLSVRAMDHAFDAFFSERAAGRGRGMGLTRAQAFARALSGDITLESRPGKGTTATLAIEGWRRFASGEGTQEPRE